jgi:haloacetate dehalogenase
MGIEAYADYLRAIQNPAVVHGMLEDYRAGIAIDHLHDAADRAAGRKVTCPTLALWVERDDLERLYGSVLDVWRPWTSDLKGYGLDSGHHMAEEAPIQLAAAIMRFLT